MPERPNVFISATKDDLGEYRTAAKDAILSAGLHPITMEHFPAEDSAPLDVCLREVENSQALVVIVAHRYGWIPPDQPPPKNKSITWLECLKAQDLGIPIFAFVVDDDHPWLPRHFEHARAAELTEFKTWLGNDRIRAKFTTPHSLKAEILAALNHWRTKDDPPQTKAEAAYLTYLRDTCAFIDLRGVAVGDNRAHRVPIENIYVPVKTHSLDRSSPGGKPVPLEEALAHKRLVIQGDPGSGKTTFLRRMVLELAREGGPRLALPVNGFPVLIRVSDLDQHIEKSQGEPGSPAQKHAPQWIAHFLAAGTWGFTAKSAEVKLKAAGTVVFLDGLDEAGNDTRRRSLVKLLEEAIRLYPECRFVVTTRPSSFDGLSGFTETRIEDLDDESVNRFLELWSNALHQGKETAADAHRAELRRALDEKPEIRRMARNPVMLTALAVVHWNDKRMPEQRAELYDSVLTWLARAREQKPGRLSPEACLDRLSTLALAMQNEPKGRLTQIERGLAADMLAPMPKKDALRFLETEELDSGIIVSRGTDLRFWHLTFQEFLAARELAGMQDQRQFEEIIKDNRLYKAEYREVMLLLAGILRTKQGAGKIHGLFEAITASVGKSFPDRARCVGLLSGMLQDLRVTGYEPVCREYLAMLAEMKKLFEPGGAKDLDLKTRVAAAEALGVSGHPFIRLPKDKDYWCEIPGHGDIKPFLMARYPVTVWEYSKFVDAGGPLPDNWDEQLDHPSRPVCYLAWYVAAVYCEWTKCRLPSGEEWMLAALGADNLPSRDKPANLGPYEVVFVPSGATPVGVFPDSRSPYGCDDMSCNVLEWTSSAYDERRDSYEARGGSSDPRSLQRVHPADTNYELGFRVARSA
ncbi:MAG: DUF4062 domain-containing protein [Bryobacteraceae bacterium]